jgi:hypothetical protein
MNRQLGALLLPALAALLLACDRETPLDTVADTTLDPAVWRADAAKISAALPPRVAAFAPTEGADPFYTSYGTGPVFGSSCAYADGPRQLVVRIESGNIRARATAALDPRNAGADGTFVARPVNVRGHPAVQRWSAGGRASEVTFLVARRYLVQVRVVPATDDSEAASLAASIDTAALEALTLEGVTR